MSQLGDDWVSCIAPAGLPSLPPPYLGKLANLPGRVIDDAHCQLGTKRYSGRPAQPNTNRVTRMRGAVDTETAAHGQTRWTHSPTQSNGSRPLGWGPFKSPASSTAVALDLSLKGAVRALLDSKENASMHPANRVH
jgi:hypothetical protein